MTDPYDPVPRSTYRLQITPDFDLDAAAATTGYLAALGVSWVYLSPILAAAPGSTHGYDVTDPGTVDPARGGPEALARFAAAARASGLGILVDIVPNHQGVADPLANPAWADLLRLGTASAHADTFDVDWAHGRDRIVLPILGDALEAVIDAGEITVDPTAARNAPDGVARYDDTALPLAPGTAPAAATADPVAVRDVLDRQHWRLTSWRDIDALAHRRFFTVTSLAGVRVEDPVVFADTHREVLRWLREGLADGLRIDHPDGLADPGAYLDDLAAAATAAVRERGVDRRPYVVVEKILEQGEQLPGWWQTDGTSGYDALIAIDRVLTDPASQDALEALDARLRAESGQPAAGYADLVYAAKRAVAEDDLRPEVRRLARLAAAALPDAGTVDDVALVDALAELLANFPVYRAYLPGGFAHVDHAVHETTRRRPDLAASARRIAQLLRDEPHGEFARRFMQTTGPVMAKGVEDRTFYRWSALTSLNEVGGDPSAFALDVAGFHDLLTRRQAAWPYAMTALTTHDTKRSEDVRARLTVLSEMPQRWDELLGRLRAIASTGDGPFDSLLWQAIIGAWPASPERLRAYALKAAREAGVHTTWTDNDADFERAVLDVVEAAHGRAVALVNAAVADIREAGWSNALTAVLLQVAGPGVPDVYQGTELWEPSLVDPDNRRPVDFAARARMLEEIDAGAQPPLDETGAAKLLVTARALRLRRHRPDLFWRYVPVEVVGPAAAHAIAFDRGGAVAIGTRLPHGLARVRGWGDTIVLLDAEPRIDVFTGRTFPGGPLRLADVLGTYPVALLVPDPGGSSGAEPGSASASGSAGSDAGAGSADAGSGAAAGGDDEGASA